MFREIFTLGLIAFFSVNASAAEYLQPTCQSILKNDLANLIKVDDTDRDGVPNILIGTAVNGVLYNYIYKGADCTVDWTALGNGGWVFNTDGEIKSFVVVDLIKNGKNEVVMNSVKSSHPGSTNPTKYATAVSVNGVEYWNLMDACGFSHSLDAADVDGTGKPNIILGTQSNSICAIKDSQDGFLAKDPKLWSYQTKYPVVFVKSADIDGDGSIETVGLASKYGDAYVSAVDKDGKQRWENRIDGGVYTAALASNLVDVVDLDGDGKSETVVGTYRDGVKVFDSSGRLKYSFDTKNMVSSILVADNGGRKTLLVGSAPNIYALDPTGRNIWTWKAPTSSTIHSMSAYDIDGDGKKEYAVGSTKFLYILDDDGTLKGSWKYKVEIQGLTKAFEERDANAVAVYMGDLDNDGDAEVAATWNWEQSTVRGNQYSLDLRVYEINRDYVPEEATTTPETPTETKTELEETAGEKTPQKEVLVEETRSGYEDAEAEQGGKNKIPCLPMFPAVFAFVLTVLADVPFAATEK